MADSEKLDNQRVKNFKQFLSLHPRDRLRVLIYFRPEHLAHSLTNAGSCDLILAADYFQ